MEGVGKTKEREPRGHQGQGQQRTNLRALRPLQTPWRRSWLCAWKSWAFETSTSSTCQALSTSRQKPLELCQMKKLLRARCTCQVEFFLEPRASVAIRARRTTQVSAWSFANVRWRSSHCEYCMQTVHDEPSSLCLRA